MLQRSTTLAAELLAGSPRLRAESHQRLSDVRTFNTFPRFEDDGQAFHVAEGDLLLDADEAFLYSLRASGNDPAPDAPLGDQDALVGITHRGAVVRWDPGLVLSYCVLRTSFPTVADYERVCTEIAAASAAWEDACDVTFQHRREFDYKKPSTTASDIDPSLIFTVRYIDSQAKFVAAAFFPTQPPVRRKVLIDPSYYRPSPDYDTVGVLRHELGHVLGFRHEHARPEAPRTCPDDVDPFALSPLTTYDPQSVMHYFCGSAGTKKLTLTELDIRGASALYGPPRRVKERLR